MDVMRNRAKIVIPRSRSNEATSPRYARLLLKVYTENYCLMLCPPGRATPFSLWSTSKNDFYARFRISSEDAET